MQAYEYKIVPAPRKGHKAKGVKGAEARFALALETVMNDFGAAGWDYMRTDILPVEERQGLTGRTTTFRHLLVFRRPLSPTGPEDTAAALPPSWAVDAPPEEASTGASGAQRISSDSA